MVQFQEHGFSVNIDTHTNPAEDWLDTVGGLIEILENQNQESNSNSNKNYKVLGLLREFMPGLDDAKKMTK